MIKKRVFPVLTILLFTMLSAASVPVYDFLTNASSATWSNPIQIVTYGGGTGSEGVVLTEGGHLEDSNYDSNYLFTQPDWRSDVSEHYIYGSYSVSIPNDVTDIYFDATVGYKQGASSSSGMSFSLCLYRYGLWTTLCSVTEYYDGTFSTMTANLSGYMGETLNLYLCADAYGDSDDDWGVWKEASITAESPTLLYVSDYGAEPNDATDDYTAIQNAIAAAINLDSPAKIVFASGEYKLSDKLDIFDAPAGLILKGTAGTRFTMTNRDEGVVLTLRSKNVSFENFTIDYDPLPFTQGTISSTGSGYSVMTIDSGYPEIDDGWLWTGATGVTAALLIDPANPGRNKLGSGDIYQISNVQKITASQFRLYGLTGAAVGDRAVYWRRKADALNLGDCPEGHILYKNINLYTGPGMVSVGGNTEKIFYRGCNFAIKPGTNRMHGPTGDGAHIQACKNGPEIIDCLFEGINDDAVNLYGVSYSIQAKYADNHFAVYTSGRMLTLGDKMVLFRPSSGTILGHAIVTTMAGHIDVNGYSCVDITIDPAIPGVITGDGNDVFYDETWMSGNFLIADSTFRNFRGTVRIKTHDGMITNSTFEGLSSTGLLLQNENSTWVEGLQPENITIQDNTFIDCGVSGSFLSEDDFAVVKIVGNGQGVLSSDKLPRNISIVGNSFTNWQRHAIYAGSAANLDIHDNNFANNASALPHPTSGHMSIMFFDDCAGVDVWDNGITDNRPSLQINGKLLANRMNVADIAAAGNTYTVNTNAPEITWLDGNTWETGVFRMSRTLTGDWSDSANPIEGWSYGGSSGGVFDLLSIHQSAWLPADLGSNQPAWADTAGGVPGWCKSIGASSSYDFPSGRVGCHGPAIARWISPRNGIVQLSGGVWLMRNWGRNQYWEIRVNGAAVSVGQLEWGPTSSSPLNFSTGSGGSSALTQTVLAGDTVELYIHKLGSAEDFVGTDFAITYVAWDLATDWSDASNPATAWSYGAIAGDGSFDLLDTHQSAWMSDDLGSNQPAWADFAGDVPGWCKSIGASSYDFPTGRVCCHGPAIARRTSTFDGTIEVNGGLWLLRNLGRDQYWELRHNGIVFTEGFLTWGPDSDNPMDFSTGSGGVDSLARYVKSGDTIDLSISKAGTYEDFVGVDFTINKVEQVDGTISGTVTDLVSGVAIQGAIVRLVGTDYSTTTASDGTYRLLVLTPDFYTMNVFKQGCYPVATSVNVEDRVTTTKDVQILSVPSSAHSWDAATDFSTNSNPNGPWEFGTFSGTTFGATFDAFSSDWITSDWNNTPGWFQSLHNQWPGVALSNGTFYLGTVPSGYMASYIPSAVKWTAPRNATVDISVSAWNPRNGTTLAVVVKGQVRAQTALSGRTYSSPYTYSLQNVSVNMGDTIMLLNGPSGDYMGFTFTITEQEPVCIARPSMDFSNDCAVDIDDLVTFIQEWLESGLDLSGPTPVCVGRPAMDFNNDCVVNMDDLADLAQEWLVCGLDLQEYCFIKQ